MKKIICIALAAILTFGALSGCGKDASSASSASSSTSSATEKTGYLTVNGETVDVPFVMKFDEYEVPIEHFRYYYLNIRDQYSYSTTDTTDLEQKVMDETMDYLKTDFALKKLAEREGITLTDDDNATIEQSIQTTVSNMGSEEDYQSQLEQSYMTADFHRTLLELDTLNSKLLSTLFEEGGKYALSEQDITDTIHQEFIHVSHMLISDEATAQEALERVQAGEDFDSLVAEYSEDSGMGEEGYTFTYGEMVQEFEDAAYALQEGETSGLVQSTYGYHIIKRLPLDETYISENLDTMTSSVKKSELNKLLDEISEAFTITYSDQFQYINTTSLS